MENGEKKHPKISPAELGTSMHFPTSIQLQGDLPAISTMKNANEMPIAILNRVDR
jgi:hypothetical protein